MKKSSIVEIVEIDNLIRHQKFPVMPCGISSNLFQYCASSNTGEIGDQNDMGLVLGAATHMQRNDPNQGP